MIQVLIRSRDKVLFDGKAKTVTSFNDVGEFDVLEGHANFITLLKDRVIVDKGLKTQYEYGIPNGVLTVFSNQVNVYVGF